MKRLHKLLIILGLVIIGTNQVTDSIQVFAIDDSIRQFYTTNQITTFDPNDCLLSKYNTSGVALKGDTVIEQILNFFMSQPNGLTLAQAAGIVGNMAQESPHGVDSKTGVNLPDPAIEQGGAIVGDDYKPKNGVGFGLVQWTFTGRQQGLVDLVTTGPMQGRKITDLDVQLTYVWQELNTSYSNTLTALKATDKPIDAAIVVHGPPYPGYEASADSPEKVRDVRGGNAEKIFDYYKDAPPLGIPSTKTPNDTMAAASNPGTTDAHKTVKPCDESFTGGNFNATLLAYAWPDYKGNDINATEAYKTAVQRALSAGQYVGGTAHPGIDCGGFVTRLMVDSGENPEYNYGGVIHDGAGNTTVQAQWLDKHWTKIDANNADDRKAGDVAISSSHTYVYVGDVDGFHSKIASASWDERAPMAGTESLTGDGFTWYRRPDNIKAGEAEKKNGVF